MAVAESFSLLTRDQLTIWVKLGHHAIKFSSMLGVDQYRQFNFRIAT